MEDLIKSLIMNRKKITVEFKKEIDECETFLEPGMRATLVNVESHNNRCSSYLFDVSAFEQYNKQLMTPNYYDSEGNPKLTAIEAGAYPEDKKVSVIICDDLPVENYLDIISDDTLELFNKYLESSRKCSYVAWLEYALLNMNYI